MIVKKIFYGIQCDRCGEMYNDGDHEFWFDEDSAIEYAIESEWIEKDGKHYCYDCYEVDDKDNILVYDDYPEYLKSIINFIQGTLKKRVYIIDRGDQFVIKSTSWHEFFKERDIDYIKSVLHDKYYEFTFDKGMRNETIFIKIKK